MIGSGKSQIHCSYTRYIYIKWQIFTIKNCLSRKREEDLIILEVILGATEV